MKRNHLGKIIVAGVLAGLSFAPSPKIASAGQVRIVDGNARGERNAPQPLPTASASASSLFNLSHRFGGCEFVGGQVATWRLFRTQPGWRKVQSQARHTERMRRQRRNA